jgi:hypothetical protein
MPLVSHWQVGATTVTDMWVTIAYLQFSRIIMVWFKLSLYFRPRRAFVSLPPCTLLSLLPSLLVRWSQRSVTCLRETIERTANCSPSGTIEEPQIAHEISDSRWCSRRLGEIGVLGEVRAPPTNVVLAEEAVDNFREGLPSRRLEAPQRRLRAKLKVSRLGCGCMRCE